MQNHLAMLPGKGTLTRTEGDGEGDGGEYRSGPRGQALVVPPADIALSSGAIAAQAAGTTGGGSVAFEWRTSGTAYDIEFSSRFTPSAEAASLARAGTANYDVAARTKSAGSAESAAFAHRDASEVVGGEAPAAGAADDPTAQGVGEGDLHPTKTKDARREHSVPCHGVERNVAGSGTFDLSECDATSTAAAAGTLHLVFENNFSWIRGKKVTLRVRCGDEANVPRGMCV